MKYLRMMFYDYGADYAERVGDFISGPFYRLSTWCSRRWLAERRSDKW